MESNRRNETDIQLVGNNHQNFERIRSNSLSGKTNYSNSTHYSSGEWKRYLFFSNFYYLPTFGRLNISFLKLFCRDRAIPEAGYITLGTLRYGVKLSQSPRSTNCLHSRSASASASFQDSNLDRSSATPFSNGNHHLESLENGLDLELDSDNRKVDDLATNSDNSSSDVTSGNGSCCINATKIPLPWLHKMDHGKIMREYSLFRVSLPLYSFVFVRKSSMRRKKNTKTFHLKHLRWVCPLCSYTKLFTIETSFQMIFYFHFHRSSFILPSPLFWFLWLCVREAIMWSNFRSPKCRLMVN